MSVSEKIDLEASQMLSKTLLQMDLHNNSPNCCV